MDMKQATVLSLTALFTAMAAATGASSPATAKSSHQTVPVPTPRPDTPPKEPVILKFYNTHNEERAEADITTPAGREKIKHILRDWRKGTEHDINDDLLDLLARIKARIEAKHPTLDVEFNIISGYRTKATNDALRKAGGSQAKNSQHTHGNAIDIRVPGVDTDELRDIAWCEHEGGVGYYKSDDFIHIDVWKKHTENKRTKNFPGGWRYRAWGWSPKPDTCKP